MSYVAAETRYEHMPYKRVGRSGLKLPLISLGLWYNFGGLDVFENSRTIARTRLRRGDLRPAAEKGLRPLSRRADHLDQGRLRHVARPVR
jgi:hypothetical protein